MSKALFGQASETCLYKTMRTIVHCSDLHFGKTDPSVVERLKTKILEVKPDVVIVSGDLTQRARMHEFAQARAFLMQLGVPRVVIPGNHDVALYNLYSRLFTPFKHYQNWVSEHTHGSYEDGQISIAAINTARSWTFNSGHLKGEALDRVGKQWANLKPDVLRILVSHHPLDLESLKRKFAWGQDSHVAAHRAWLCKPDVLCSGHLHGTAAYIQKGCVQIAAGTATSTRLRKEANSFNVICAESKKVSVKTYLWGGDSFEILPEKIFVKEPDGWTGLNPGVAKPASPLFQ